MRTEGNISTSFRAVLLFSASVAVCAPHVTAAAENDWPHWRGPDRSDVVGEDSRYAQGAWPPSNVAWQKNVGTGSTSPLVVDGRLYVLGWDGRRDKVFCLNATTGAEIWRTSYTAPKFGRNAVGDQGVYSAITATPEFDPKTGFLYTLSIDGDLNCWDTASDGQRVWGINLYDEYDVRRRPKVGRSGQRDYGFTTAPLIHEDCVIVEVGDDEGNLMAFAKDTGRRRWVSQCKDPAGHTGGPAPISVEGVPSVAVLTHNGLLVARMDRGNEGRTVAQYGWVTEFANNIASATVHDDCVLITSGYNHTAICKLKITLKGATKLWQQPVCSKVCSPIVYNKHIYWVWRRPVCLDFETGKVKWTGPATFSDAASCIVTADGRLIIWSNRGDLVLAETADRSPERYRELLRVGGTFRTDVWPHVVLAGGRIYCKDRSGNLKCFALQACAR